MARPLSGRERLLVLGAAAAVVAYFAVRPHLGSLADLGPRAGRLAAEKTEVIDSLRRMVGREDSLKAEAEAVAGEIAAFERVLLPGATPPLAAADLQTRLKEIAERAGLKIQSEKTLAHVRRDAYLEIPVQIVANGQIDNLRDFLLAVEASPVFIAVQDVSLRTVKRRQFVPETRSYTDVSDIQANMTLVGLIGFGQG